MFGTMLSTVPGKIANGQVIGVVLSKIGLRNRALANQVVLASAKVEQSS